MRVRERIRARKLEHRQRIKRAIVVSLIAILLFGVIYANDYYRTDTESANNFLANSDVHKEYLKDGSIAYIPDNATTGIIFYPGGKVEYTAYEPLMQALADKGIVAVLLKMPINLAILKTTAAEGIPELIPEVEHWYMAGHSLGGTAAASYVADNADKFDGLILLASYTTEDISATDLDVLSVYGSLDGVMNRDRYEKNLKNLPEGYTEQIIKGGNHSFFGMYGYQKNDQQATITNARQIKLTADIIAEFVK